MIILRDYESHDGMIELISCTVEDFADQREVKDVLDTFDKVVGKIKHAEQIFRREEGSAWEIPGGLLVKNASKKACGKVEKALAALGYADHIERKHVSKAELRGGR